VTDGCLAAGDGLRTLRRVNQRESAGDGLALNRLALATNGGSNNVLVQKLTRDVHIFASLQQ